MATTKQRVIYWPCEAAEMLGLTSAQLTAIIRRRRYPFTEVAPGGKPGDRGRNRWGLTDAQIEAIVKGQAKVLPDPATTTEPDRKPSPVSPDGKSRLRRDRGAR